MPRDRDRDHDRDRDNTLYNTVIKVSVTAFSTRGPGAAYASRLDVAKINIP
jgi:hypothetical protein